MLCSKCGTEGIPGNNNGQISGYSEGGGPADRFWFGANGCQDLSASFVGGYGVAYGLNDFAQIVGEIYDWFTEGFDTADLIDAKALLDQLAI